MYKYFFLVSALILFVSGFSNPIPYNYQLEDSLAARGGGGVRGSGNVGLEELELELIGLDQVEIFNILTEPQLCTDITVVTRILGATMTTHPITKVCHKILT